MNNTKTPSPFHFKQFSILANDAGMAVSTDAVLLGAWCDVNNEQRKGLDIGCGSGILSLMLAQRFEHLTIDALDVDPTAIKATAYNISHSEWPTRIQVVEQDVMALSVDKSYDMIICNPPYFTSGETTQNSERALARHIKDFNHQSLLDKCHQLLSNIGTATFILPTVEGDALIKYALTHGWYLQRQLTVQTTPRKPIARLLFSLSKHRCETEHSTLTIRDSDGEYSHEFVSLTRAFYLKM